MKKNNHFSLIIIMISLSLFGSYHIYYHFFNRSNDNLIRDYYTNNTFTEEKQIAKKISNEKEEEYLGILKIPKIGLSRGFYKINSSKNNINNSITILKESTMPNINGSIIYLTAHSGYGYLAFFNNIDKLILEDIIRLDLDNKTFNYAVSDIYEIDKTGSIMVNHNIHENLLVLSTCSKNKDKQLVVVSKLVNKI